MKVLIIGGGVVGMTIAREFLKSGADDIVLIDQGELGKEASYAAAGMLSPQAESNTNDLFFRFCCEARDSYPEFAEEIQIESGVDIELDRTGTISAAFGEKDEAVLSERFHWQTAAGLQVDRLSGSETHRLEPFISPDTVGSLFFPNDWQIENRALLRGLEIIVRRSCFEIHESTSVKSLIIDGESVSGVLTKDNRTIEGDLVILATGAWTSLIETGLNDLSLPEIRPVRGQIISYQTAKRLLTHVIYSRRGYVVPRHDGRVLAGATVEDAGFENEVTEAGVEFLKGNSVELIPSFAKLKVSESWSGLRPCSSDKLPMIGMVPGCRNLYLSTGHYRNGVLLAPLSAKLLTESVFRKEYSEYLTKFSPARLSVAGASN